MDKKPLKALKGSISKWYGISYLGKEDNASRDCPLCILAEKDEDGIVLCSSCIIYKHTGKEACFDTPYYDYDDYMDRLRYADDSFDQNKAIEYAISMMDFLISLLPEGETAIVDGWEYGWRWA